jgi:hypothetical protein
LAVTSRRCGNALAQCNTQHGPPTRFGTRTKHHTNTRQLAQYTAPTTSSPRAQNTAPVQHHTHHAACARSTSPHHVAHCTSMYSVARAVANYAHAAVRRVVRCGGLSVRQPRPSCDPSTFCIRPLVVIVITRSENKVWMQWQHARAGTSKISNGSSSSSSRIGCSDNSLAYAGVATWTVPTGTATTCSSASTVCWERSQ